RDTDRLQGTSAHPADLPVLPPSFPRELYKAVPADDDLDRLCNAARTVLDRLGLHVILAHIDALALPGTATADSPESAEDPTANARQRRDLLDLLCTAVALQDGWSPAHGGRPAVP
ncbi:MAG: hypothetical protein EA398_16380, partial [Deltaproteobacteria bacterium]